MQRQKNVRKYENSKKSEKYVIIKISNCSSSFFILDKITKIVLGMHLNFIECK